jgi:hypothetical protein
MRTACTPMTPPTSTPPAPHPGAADMVNQARSACPVKSNFTPRLPALAPPLRKRTAWHPRQSHEADCGVCSVFCAVHRPSQRPTDPACPPRRSPAPVLPLITRVLAAGGGLTGATAGGGPRPMCKRKVNARHQPLDSKRPKSCPTAGSAFVPRPHPPTPAPSPLTHPAPIRTTATLGGMPCRSI